MTNESNTNRNILSALNELRDLYEILISDVRECTDVIQKQDTQFARRTFVRSVFAFVEGVVFRLKQMALEASSELQVSLSIPEVAVLSEETYELNDKGEPSAKSNYPQLPRNTKFAFKIVAYVFSINYKLKIDDSGWASFLEAIKIRNRLMHPKTIQETSISDEDLEIVGKALMWFIESELGLVKQARMATQNIMNWSEDAP
jgi:hypothetical protein